MALRKRARQKLIKTQPNAKENVCESLFSQLSLKGNFYFQLNGEVSIYKERERDIGRNGENVRQ